MGRTVRSHLAKRHRREGRGRRDRRPRWCERARRGLGWICERWYDRRGRESAVEGYHLAMVSFTTPGCHASTRCRDETSWRSPIAVRGNEEGDRLSVVRREMDGWEGARPKVGRCASPRSTSGKAAGATRPHDWSRVDRPIEARRPAAPRLECREGERASSLVNRRGWEAFGARQGPRRRERWSGWAG